MSAIAIGIFLILAVFGCVAVILVPRIMKAQAENLLWKPLPTRPAVKVLLPAPKPEVTIGVVDMCLGYAVTSLVNFGPWSRDTIELTMPRLQIIVNENDSWVDSAGQRIGGQADFCVATVDVHLTSLCHELAHVLEFAREGKVDVKHTSWVARGIHAADEDYRKKLAGIFGGP